MGQLSRFPTFRAITAIECEWQECQRPSSAIKRAITRPTRSIRRNERIRRVVVHTNRLHPNRAAIAPRHPKQNHRPKMPVRRATQGHRDRPAVDHRPAKTGKMFLSHHVSSPRIPEVPITRNEINNVSPLSRFSAERKKSISRHRSSASASRRSESPKESSKSPRKSPKSNESSGNSSSNSKRDSYKRSKSPATSKSKDIDLRAQLGGMPISLNMAAPITVSSDSDPGAMTARTSATASPLTAATQIDPIGNHMDIDQSTATTKGEQSKDYIRHKHDAHMITCHYSLFIVVF